LFLDLSPDLESGVLLVADAYYASAKVVKPLLKAGHHVLSRVRRNSVAYERAPKRDRSGPGRPRQYGDKRRLWDLWQTQSAHFQRAPSPVYGETAVTIRYYTRELLWRPIGQLVRFVWVEHPTRGRLILMCTDRGLSALEIIAAYGYRFKIEIAFKQALYTLGSYGYHFWMKVMTPRPQRSGNQYLHRTSDDYRRLVRRKLDAYHRYVLLGCIAQGLLQYLALTYRVEVWRAFRSWLRTMKPAQPPSEAVVSQALRNALPQFLLTAPEEDDLKKFILDHTDFDRSPVFQVAA